MERSTGTAMIAAPMVVLLYLLSPPFVAWTMMRLGLDDFGPAMRFIYAPAIQLYEHFPPYRTLLDGLFKVLVP